MTARKNRGIRDWRNGALFGSLLLMMAGAAVSRGTLSIGIILFVSLALLRKDFFSGLKTFAATPLLWSLLLLFFIPFVSGLWSNDLNKWSDVVRIKLPLLFLPLAFAGGWKFSKRQWTTIVVFFLLIVFAGCLWSLTDYAQHATQVHENYLRAKTLRTPLEDDHVRFSWLVSVAVIACVALFNALQQTGHKASMLVLAIFFVVYLHILSARTGLLSLYLFLFLYTVYAAVKTKSRKRLLLTFSALIALPLLAYVALPTFKARLRYNLYDLSFVRKAQYLPGSSDGARTMSLKAGWQVLQKNAFGVGAGDVMIEAEKWYAANVPEVLPTDKFYPSSEWLMYGAFAGWLGVVLFTAVMLLPFFMQPTKGKLYWIGFHTGAAASFIFDAGLEIQYGVFLYAFLACVCWKLCTSFNDKGTFSQQRFNIFQTRNKY